jgi:hypothetical protein
MLVKRNIKPTRLVEFEKNHKFTDSSHLRRLPDGRIYVTSAFCQNGHRLITNDTRFDGLKGIKLLVHGKDKRGIVIVSPIINDQRKDGPSFGEGTRVRICCPTCHEELDQLVPCTCSQGAYRRAIYLTANPRDLGAIGICDTYGCPQSFVNADGELLFEVETIE